MSTWPPQDLKLERASASDLNAQQYEDGSQFPAGYLCRDENAQLTPLLEAISGARDELLVEATQHGAVLFRGLPMPTANEFDQFIQALQLPNFPYAKSLSNAVRVNRTERVFSANEAPPDVQIFFHHEMAQTPLFPRWIMFYCEIAPEVGGATPICRSDILLKRLEADCPEFVAACREKGLKYTNVMPSENDAQSGMGRSWKSTLGVDSREAAEQRLQDLNYSWVWREDGCLEATTPPLPAVRETISGRPVFFNQLIAAFSGWKDSRNDPSKAIRHGDGNPLDPAAVARAIELANELSYDLEWQPGDAVLIDNTIAMHARKPFSGTRKVLASLACMETQSFELAEAR
ncbi:TauD/TfdA family dioxygenase [Rubinisphaera margarita]|uniref:TauD/TfdA family dioxygenase n=1 Tax=Rubinisphaera margarita TaxID=2909586 RepID=UPI001EE938A3|nr:TauD/TfdA family dioxygenase [Rubinisphaera margarita]MCG6155556.1 TauD/TfdA family dioxygenase [Rubinisphaera margarita]